MSIQHMMAAKNLFDCMAIAFVDIGGANKMKLQSVLNRYRPDQYCDISSLMKMYLPEAGNQTIQFRALLPQIVLLLKHQPDYECSCYAIIEAIDCYADLDKCSGLLYYSHVRRVLTLAESVPEIIILPRNKDSFINIIGQWMKIYEKSQRPRAFGYRDPLRDNSEINVHLKKFDICHSSSISKTVELIQFDRDLLDRSSDHLRDYLRFGIFPLINEDKKQLFDHEESPLTFSIQNIKTHHATTILRKCKAALRASIDAQVDIAIFPELLLNDQIISELLTDIQEIDSRILPRLIVLGSVWQNRANRCIVISNTGNIVMEHFKQNPYMFELRKEDLSLENSKIQFMDYPMIGRIFTYICCDINSEEMLGIVERFGGNLLLLPSFSPSLDLKTKAEDLAKSYVCSTVMCNSCSALELDRTNWTGCVGKEVGFIAVPGKKNTSNWCKVELYKMVGSCLLCDDNSCGWIATLFLNQIEQEVSKEVAIKISIDPILRNPI